MNLADNILNTGTKERLSTILASRLFFFPPPLNTAFGRSRVAKRWQRHQQPPSLPVSVRPRSYAVFRVKPKPEQTRRRGRRRRRDLPRGRRSSRSTYHRCHRTSQCGPTDCGMSVQVDQYGHGTVFADCYFEVAF